MLSVAINGRFMAMRIQGIARYARELVQALDEIVCDDDNVMLLVPRNVKNIPNYRRIRVVRIGSLNGGMWEQIDLAAWSITHPESLLINLCNVAPLFARPGVTAIHDIMYRSRPDFYITIRNRISRVWHCLQYSVLLRRERIILTVSEFSRQEIEKYYSSAIGKVKVIPDAWQHVLNYEEAKDWKNRYSDLVCHDYYFTMATIARNKNGRWIYEVAKRNPELLIVIAGKRYENDETDCPQNVKLLGFVSDSDACALIKNCKAFLYPSIYEGFGLPPLEALALGAEVIASKSTSLPEVLGDSVHYIDPYNYEYKLDELIKEHVAPASDALKRYSWNKSAELLYSLLTK